MHADERSIDRARSDRDDRMLTIDCSEQSANLIERRRQVGVREQNPIAGLQ